MNDQTIILFGECVSMSLIGILVYLKHHYGQEEVDKMIVLDRAINFMFLVIIILSMIGICDLVNKTFV